jgi:hypothetical protein
VTSSNIPLLTYLLTTLAVRRPIPCSHRPASVGATSTISSSTYFANRSHTPVPIYAMSSVLHLLSSSSPKSLLTAHNFLQRVRVQRVRRKFFSSTSSTPPRQPVQGPTHSSSSSSSSGGSFTDSIIALAKYSVPLIAVCTIISIWGPRTTVREIFNMKDQADVPFQEEFLRERKVKEMQRIVTANASIPGRITIPNKLNNNEL